MKSSKSRRQKKWKRSKTIRLVLIGTVSTAALGGCDGPAPITSNNVYTNNYYVPGAGYYHAPYRGWYYLPYNHFEAKTGQYYYGGHWGFAPMQSFTNVSSPAPLMAQQAEAMRTDVSRGGFGGSAYYGGS
jgi:hypothetical protein